jgi:hypothetical protein
MWYTHIRGYHPQTGQEVDRHDCAIAWLPVLLMENTQQQRSTGAAVESFRNEMINDNASLGRILLGAQHEQSRINDGVKGLLESSQLIGRAGIIAHSDC